MRYPGREPSSGPEAEVNTSRVSGFFVRGEGDRVCGRGTFEERGEERSAEEKKTPHGRVGRSLGNSFQLINQCLMHIVNINNRVYKCL